MLFAIVFLLASLTVTSKVNVRTAKAEDIFHEGDLILSGNNVTIIENQVLHINGSIIITENATLIIRNNGLINFTQQYSTQFNMTLKDPVDGNPRLIMENNGSVTGNDWHIYLNFYAGSILEAHKAATNYYVSFYFYSSSANITESEFWSIYLYENAVLNMTNSWVDDIRLYGYSKAAISNTEISSDILASVYAEVTVSNCTITSAEARHYSKCYLYDSVITNATLYEYAQAWLFNTTVTNGMTYNNSVAYIHGYLDAHVTDFVGQDIPSANVTAYDLEDVVVESRLTGIDGRARLTLMAGFVNATDFYWTGTYTIVTSYMGCSNSTLVDMYGNIELDVKLGVFYTYPASYNGDIILKDNECLCINGLLNINGSIIVEDNAILILNNGWINFTQEGHNQFSMTIRGDADLIVENGNITTNNYQLFLTFEGNSAATINGLRTTAEMQFIHYSKANISNSILEEELIVAHYANASVSNCMLNQLILSGYTTCLVSDSTVSDYVSIDIRSANATIMNLTPGHVDSWNALQAFSPEIALDGFVPNVTITNTDVNSWIVHFLEKANTTIRESKLKIIDCHGTSKTQILNSNITMFIYADDMAFCYAQDTVMTMLLMYEESKVCAINTTIIGTPSVSDNAVLYIGWWLNIHVVDLNNANVPNADITITDSEGNTVAYGETQSNGWARFTLTEKLVNATGTYPYGNYTVQATYESYSNSQQVMMNGNKEITIQLPFILPEFSPITLLLALLALTLAMLCVNKKLKQK